MHTGKPADREGPLSRSDEAFLLPDYLLDRRLTDAPLHRQLMHRLGRVLGTNLRPLLRRDFRLVVGWNGITQRDLTANHDTAVVLRT